MLPQQQQQQWSQMAPAPQQPQPIPQHPYYQQQQQQYQQYQQYQEYQQPPPQYQQYQQQAPSMSVPVPQQPQYPSGGQNEVRTLWIGELQYWMDELFLKNCFGQTGEVTNTKVIRNKQTQQPEGYGFIEFVSHAAAERALQTYNGQMMPNIDQVFKLNWASNGAGDKRTDDGADYTIFVGDLAADVTDFLLLETFKSHYPSVKSANVVIDKLTQRSKGYGFVKFGDPNEQTRAMTEMNGFYCSTRPMRIGAAANKKNFGAQQQYSSNASYQNSQGFESDNDPNNTTIFVGGLDPNVTDDLLRQVFSPYGELVYVKIPSGKRCGFVQFSNRASAEEALKVLNGTLVGAQNVRLSWGRSPPNKQSQQDSNNWNGNYYGYSQTHDAYGHAPPQDPNMYAYASYPGYANYPQQQPPAPPAQ